MPDAVQLISGDAGSLPVAGVPVVGRRDIISCRSLQVKTSLMDHDEKRTRRAWRHAGRFACVHVCF